MNGMVSLPSAEIAFGILCDGVRREDNGKLILLGVYGRNIMIQDFPGNLRFHVVTRYKPRVSSFTLTYRVKVADEVVLYIRGKTESRDLELETSATPEFTVSIEGPCLLQIDVTDENTEDLSAAQSARWHELIMLPFERLDAEITSSSV